MEAKTKGWVFPLVFFGSFFLLLLGTALIGGEMLMRYSEPLPLVSSLAEGDSALSYRLRANLAARHIEEGKGIDVSIATNGKGLRDKEIFLQKPWNTERIIVLGGSSVFGWGLKAEETFPKLLEQQLAGISEGTHLAFEVVNAGVPGYSMSQSVKWFQTELSQYSPNWLVLVDSEAESVGPSLHFLEKGELREVAPPVFQQDSLVCSLLKEKLQLAAMFCGEEHLFQQPGGNIMMAFTEESMQLRIALIRELAKGCREKGTRLLVVARDEYDEKRFREALSPFGVSTMVFASTSREGTPPAVGFLNRDGNKLLAEKLFRFLQGVYLSGNPKVSSQSQ